MDMENIIEKRFKLFSPFLNEKQRRILAAIEAQILGYGGASRVAKTTGLSRNTVAAGALELERDKIEDIAPIKERIRKPGGGRKRTIQKDHTLKADLEQLIEPVTRGDPESALLWTCKSVRRLADELKKMGHETSHRMVAEMLGQMGYSLQANRKTIEGGSHPDRDAQFEYIHQKVKQFQKQRQPVISVDTKKKELVGNFKNQGREWRPKGSPEEVLVYDFESLGGGKITPYGVYDLSQNKGWVSVGVDKDTAAFAVESIRRWWKTMGHKVYPMAKRLLITADGGGSNGSRVRLWKTELQKLSNETGLSIFICHFPPGTSKWNKIEHRLFSFISQNWRGKPLISHEVIVNLISSTTTKTGLQVECEIDPNSYPKGVKVTDKELKAVNLLKDSFYGEWNYTIKPNVTRN
ncbi:MAG: ISAzo13 family transposase [Syntrophaceae bacterium CG2_30_49_12]|nr:MAG: ISAzo13 family transposase [Syntrophaceae bacterium CG2_30_49_12]